jgi:plastocyanin
MRTIAALLLVAAAAMALGACGGGDDSQASGEADLPSFNIETPPGKEVLAYTDEDLSTEAGEVIVNFYNPQPIRHNIVFEDSSGKIVGRSDRIFDRASSKIIEFEPGEYTFFCSLGAGTRTREGGESHREAGMEGTLTVE